MVGSPAPSFWRAARGTPPTSRADQCRRGGLKSAFEMSILRLTSFTAIRDAHIFRLACCPKHPCCTVTIVLSKKRRNAGPNQVRLFVTNLQEVKASTVLSLYAWRWSVEVTIKELKGGWHLGQMQVTWDADRVARSVALSVCAYLLLVRLYGRDEETRQPWSLFRLKQRFHADLMREEIDRTERKWQRKLKQYEDTA